MSKSIEVEDGEIAVFSTTGILSIIPRNKARWVKQKIKEKCFTCVDEYVKTLQDIGHKAEK